MVDVAFVAIWFDANKAVLLAYPYYSIEFGPYRVARYWWLVPKLSCLPLKSLVWIALFKVTVWYAKAGNYVPLHQVTGFGASV